MRGAITRLAPGLALCTGIALLARLAQAVGEGWAGRSPIDALVLAILLGAALRAAWEPGERWRPGIRLTAGLLLEVAVVLLGASLDLRAVIAAGPALLLGVAAVVALALAAGYGIGRLLALGPRMAMLVACGNAICGNSAIAAVAPVIGAGARDVAAAIAFTAVLGVLVVLALPLAVRAFGLSAPQYGTLAGLTVYAVPQVLAATAPFGSAAMQAGTLVKLLRVLMLGPVVLVLGLIRGGAGDGRGFRLSRFVPWFVAGFLLMAVLRGVGVLPEAALVAFRHAAGLLTALAMAALGLGVDLGGVARSGPRVLAAAAASLFVLLGLAIGLVAVLGPA